MPFPIIELLQNSLNILKPHLRHGNQQNLSDAPSAGVHHPPTEGDQGNTHSKMGKSNKFDFSNRVSGGVKLGLVIGDALRKEVEKAKKDAGRQAAKVKKQSVESTANLEAGKNLSIHVIDLIASGRALGDDGVAALAQGLEDALKAGTNEASLSFEEVSLQDNGLTTKSLALLAPVIVLAKHDLKSINLSGNNIRVWTREEAAEWKTFLLAFKDCRKLRRLDFSSNRNLGSKALEILAQVHEFESPIVPISAGGDTSVYSLEEQEAYKPSAEEYLEAPLSDYFQDKTPVMHPLAGGRLLKRHCGLRSIPYMTFADVGLTDAGALWLSFTLEDHYFPEQLTNEINAASATSSVAAHRQSHGSEGIEWEGNEITIGKDGLQLLKKTELSRRETMLDDASCSSEVVIIESPQSALASKFMPSGSLNSTKRRRRESVRSNSPDRGGFEFSELDSIRHKIQRHILQENGVRSVDLWRAAVKFITLSRRLTILAPTGWAFDDGDMAFREIQHLGNWPIANASYSSATRFGNKQSTVTAFGSEASISPFLDITNHTNQFKGNKRDGHADSDKEEQDDVVIIEKKMKNLAIRNATPREFLHWQNLRNVAAAPYRDLGKACRLPLHLAERIIGYLMEDFTETMSERQREEAYAWAQLRDTLHVEREWVKMTESAQKLMLLDRTSCLAYEHSYED